jgi:hypothetical protein
MIGDRAPWFDALGPKLLDAPETKTVRSPTAFAPSSSFEPPSPTKMQSAAGSPRRSRQSR